MFFPTLWGLSWDHCYKIQINEENKKKFTCMHTSCIHMGDTQGKWVTSWDGLEFRLKYHLNREWEGEFRLPVKEQVNFRKDEWTLRRKDGSYDSLWWSFSRCAVWRLLVSYPVMSRSFLGDETTGEGTYYNWVPLEGLSLGR